MATVATLASREQAKTTITINCRLLKPETQSLDISADETLKGLVDKVSSIINMKDFVLWWDGRLPTEILLPLSMVSKRDTHYMVFWRDHEGPAIELSVAAPEKIRQLTGVHEPNKFTKVAHDLLAKIKVKDVCDLTHRNEISVIVHPKFIGRQEPTVASASSSQSAQSTLVSAKPQKVNSKL